MLNADLSQIPRRVAISFGLFAEIIWVVAESVVTLHQKSGDIHTIHT
jgi:hypothetical protein